MSDNVYKKLEIVGSSETSIEDAVQKAISKAGETVKHIEWFEIGEVRGHVEDAKVRHYQVVVKIGFRIED